VQRSQPLLGTFVTVTAYGENSERVQAAVTEAFDEIRRVDLLLSIHKAESETARLNEAAGKGPVRVSRELREVLETALRIAERTEGAFDPTIGPLAQLWGFIWKEYRLPSETELNRTLPLVGYKQVQLHRAGAVSFARPEMSLDFGGIGKGYAVDRAIQVLEARGITNAMVKAGGDLRVLGAPPGKDAWEVQIEDAKKQRKRATVRLRDSALSTSGNYENYFEVDGRRYSHIIDPRTGLPIQGIASCTVIAKTCTESDAFATGFFVLGIERSLRDFGEEFGIRFVDSRFRVRESKGWPGSASKK
jgi:thiamine biosynthesis lipoprotein ApbE